MHGHMDVKKRLVLNRRYSPYVLNRRYSPYVLNRRYSPYVLNRGYSPYVLNRRYSPYVLNRRYSPYVLNRRYSPYVRTRKTKNFFLFKEVPVEVLTLGSAYFAEMLPRRQHASGRSCIRPNWSNFPFVYLGPTAKAELVPKFYVPLRASHAVFPTLINQIMPQPTFPNFRHNKTTPPPLPPSADTQTLFKYSKCSYIFPLPLNQTNKQTVKGSTSNYLTFST
jgi:hypothetical protein